MSTDTPLIQTSIATEPVQIPIVADITINRVEAPWETVHITDQKRRAYTDGHNVPDDSFCL